MALTPDEERKRTSEALNSIYEQASGETAAMFRTASERFIEIVRQMREMSAAMAREMETTRTELRKGILELPQETAETARQLPRAISPNNPSAPLPGADRRAKGP